MFKKNKKGQEEMVGFALIVVLVTVILVILLAIMFHKTQNAGQIESYQVESFISAVLLYSSECSTTKQRHLPIRGLIGECLRGGSCLDTRDSCDVLNETISNIVEESWKTENRPAKGYRFTIGEEGSEPKVFSSGNTTTKNSRFSSQMLYIGSRTVSVNLEIWS